jgi:hypothetical protein
MVAVRTLAIAGLIALVADAGMAQVGFKDGNTLLAECRETESRPADQHFQRGFCLGYIEGIADYLELVRERSGLQPCVPDAADCWATQRCCDQCPDDATRRSEHRRGIAGDERDLQSLALPRTLTRKEAPNASQVPLSSAPVIRGWGGEGSSLRTSLYGLRRGLLTT